MLVLERHAPEGCQLAGLQPAKNERVDLFECASVTDAHEYLIDVLSEFESAAIVRRTDASVGDVAFGTDSVVLFARSNLVVLIRKATPQAEAVLPVAQAIDALVLGRLKAG